MTVDASPTLGPPIRSMFNRVIGQPRPFWVVMVVSLLLFLAPFAAAYLDGSWNIFLQGFWRPLLVPSVVIVYILAAGQLMARSESQALTAFRPVVLVSDEEFDRIVREASRTSRSNSSSLTSTTGRKAVRAWDSLLAISCPAARI